MSGPYQRLPKSIFGKVAIAEVPMLRGFLRVQLALCLFSLERIPASKEAEWSGATLYKSLILLNGAVSYAAACRAE
jgi:hypothetical protein